MTSGNLSRRHLLAGLGIALIARPAVAGQDDLLFRVMREGRDIGRHSVAYIRDGSTKTVQITTDIKVGFGPITLYRYTQRATEIWTDGLLTKLVSETGDDGTKDYVRAVRTNVGLVVEGSAGPAFTAPPHARAASHWSPRQFDGPMFSVQNGAMHQFVPTLVGREIIQSRGAPIEVTRHVLGGKIKVELWYDVAGIWVGLRLVGPDGSVITYERI